jgi:hypothetical protein
MLSLKLEQRIGRNAGCEMGCVGSEQRLSGGRPAQAVSGRSQDFARLTGCPLRVVLPYSDSELPPPNGIVC